jgi:uncharacterized protein (TIGR03437 family)
VSVFSGFQTATAPGAFQITGAIAGLPVPVPILPNALPGLNGTYAGAIVSLFGNNLSAVGIPVVSIGGLQATVLYSSPTQLNLILPAALTPGPASLTVNTGALTSFPVTVNIDSLPAAINAIQGFNGNYIDSTHAIHQSDGIIVTLSNFGSPGAVIDPSRVQVWVGGVSHPAILVTPISGVVQVSFQMNPDDPVGLLNELIVYLDGRSSYPAYVPVAHPDGTFTQ